MATLNNRAFFFKSLPQLLHWQATPLSPLSTLSQTSIELEQRLSDICVPLHRSLGSEDKKDAS
jgi:hypothetical protein